MVIWLTGYLVNCCHFKHPVISNAVRNLIINSPFSIFNSDVLPKHLYIRIFHKDELQFVSTSDACIVRLYIRTSHFIALSLSTLLVIWLFDVASLCSAMPDVRCRMFAFIFSLLVYYHLFLILLSVSCMVSSGFITLYFHFCIILYYI